MVIYLKNNLYTFAGILCICLYFFCATFWNASKLYEARTLSQPIGVLKIEAGQITNVRKIKGMFVIFPKIKQYVDYEYEIDDEIRNYTFRCRNMSACYWLTPGSADIIVAKNGRHALPLELINSLPTYRKRFMRRTRGCGVMSLITLCLTIFCAFRVFRK